MGKVNTDPVCRNGGIAFGYRMIDGRGAPHHRPGTIGMGPPRNPFLEDQSMHAGHVVVKRSCFDDAVEEYLVTTKDGLSGTADAPGCYG